MIQGTPRLPGTDDAYKNKPPEYIPTFDQLALQVYCFLFEAKALLLRPSLWLTTRDKDKAQELLGAYDIVKRSASQAIRTLQAFPSNERVYVILTTGCHFCLVRYDRPDAYTNAAGLENMRWRYLVPTVICFA